MPIFLSSASEKKSWICLTLSVSLSYCFATEGSVLESTSLDLSCSGILKDVEVEKSLPAVNNAGVVVVVVVAEIKLAGRVKHNVYPLMEARAAERTSSLCAAMVLNAITSKSTDDNATLTAMAAG